MSITSSYGVAVVPTHASTPEKWLKAADDALYDAKRLGRNLVRFSGEPPVESHVPKRPPRQSPEPGGLSDEAKEELRLQILRRGGALCPVDQVPLTVIDVTTQQESGKSFVVNCPGCGFDADLPGPGRA